MKFYVRIPATAAAFFFTVNFTNFFLQCTHIFWVLTIDIMMILDYTFALLTAVIIEHLMNQCWPSHYYSQEGVELLLLKVQERKGGSVVCLVDLVPTLNMRLVSVNRAVSILTCSHISICLQWNSCYYWTATINYS